MFPVTLVSPGQNEATWLEISTRSVIHLVDELLYFDDNSIDDSMDIAKALSDEFQNFKIVPCPDVKGKKRFSSILNRGFEMSRNEWVMHWAPDFIAYSEGDHAIQNLFDKAVGQNEWDAIVFKAPNVAGDIFHSFPSERGGNYSQFSGPEPYLWRKGHFRIVPGENYPDTRQALKETRYCWTHENHHFLHMNTLKPIEKQAYRSHMVSYLMRPQEYSEFTYWHWAAMKRMGKSDISQEEIEKEKTDSIRRLVEKPIQLMDYDFDRWGHHPAALLDSDVWKKFKIIELQDGNFTLNYPIDCM